MLSVIRKTKLFLSTVFIRHPNNSLLAESSLDPPLQLKMKGDRSKEEGWEKKNQRDQGPEKWKQKGGGGGREIQT